MNNIAINPDRLFESAVDGIVVIDTKGIVKLVNPAMYRLFGYTKEELVGQNINTIMPNPHKKNHDAYIRNYLKTGQAKIMGIGRDVIAQRKDGSLFPIRLAVSEVEDKGEHLFIGIIQDITEIKEAEEKIKQLNAELEEKVAQRTQDLARAVTQLSQSNVDLAKEIVEREKIENALRESEKRLRKSLEKERSLNEMKGRFLSMASHEFRTPLATILSSADIIEAYSDANQQNKRLKHTKRIKSTVHNLNLILDDFLSSARLESGATELSVTPFSIEKFLVEIQEKAEGYLKEGQKIIVFYDFDGKNNIIHTDKHYLENIMHNLLSNAVKYSDEWTEIKCQVHYEGDMLSIAIEDHGIGIPQKEQEFLFSRFFRASNVENIKGTGLGLSITKQYIELLEGEITIKSKEGQGTTVSFSIPNLKDKL